MYNYDFGDGVSAEVADREGQFLVLIDDKGDKTEVSGFPSKQEAENFIHFGDLDTFGSDNDFIMITKPKYELKWS